MMGMDCVNRQARERGLTKRSQAERLAIADSLIASVWEEYLNGSIDRGTLQVAAYIQANVNRIVWKLNELNNPNTQDAIEALMAEFKRVPTTAIRAKTVIEQLPSVQPKIIRCKECKHSEHWYRDRRRCFLWSEDGVSVFDDGFCNYAERRTDESD